MSQHRHTPIKPVEFWAALGLGSLLSVVIELLLAWVGRVAIELEDEIRSYIIENMLYGDDSIGLATDTSLLSEGIVDSLGVVELVQYVESQFGVTVASDEIIPANFDSVASLADYVRRKQRTA